MIRRSGLAAQALLLILLASDARALSSAGSAEDCPESEISVVCGYIVDQLTSAPNGSVSQAFTIVPWQAGETCPFTCYDLPHGRLEATVEQLALSNCSSAVLAHDTFRLVGPPGPSVSFEAVLQVECTVTDSGSATAAIFGSSTQIANFLVSGNVELVQPLAVDPNTAFPLQYAVVARTWRIMDSGHGRAGITGDLRFRGVPAGYTITSCNGYDLPVPTAATSWGRLKAHYR